MSWQWKWSLPCGSRWIRIFPQEPKGKTKKLANVAFDKNQNGASHLAAFHKNQKLKPKMFKVKTGLNITKLLSTRTKC